MARIAGITITLIEKIESGKDAFDHTVYSEKRVKVENVLVAPAQTLNLTGKKAVYNIAIPKGDKHNWKDNIVEFFGEKWQIIGFPQRGIEENIPLDWNQKWMVARYE